MAQLTVMSGRKTPSAEYKAGEYRSITISRAWTMAAMTAINNTNLRKLKFTVGRPAQVKAPGASRK